MIRPRLAYSIGFPLVTFTLCGFSYYLGFTRGKQAASVTKAPEESPPISDESHETGQELTFFKTLKEEGETPPLESKPIEPKPMDASKAAPKKAAPVAKATADRGHYIQISAFKDIGKAHELIDEIKVLGFPAIQKGSAGWHRVYVGPYESKARAEVAMAELAQKGFQKGFVTTLGPAD